MFHINIYLKCACIACTRAHTYTQKRQIKWKVNNCSTGTSCQENWSILKYGISLRNITHLGGRRMRLILSNNCITIQLFKRNTILSLFSFKTCLHTSLLRFAFSLFCQFTIKSLLAHRKFCIVVCVESLGDCVKEMGRCAPIPYFHCNSPSCTTVQGRNKGKVRELCILYA